MRRISFASLFAVALLALLSAPGKTREAETSSEDWWSMQMREFQEQAPVPDFSTCEFSRLRAGGSWSLYEDDMKDSMGDDFVLTSSNRELSEAAMTAFRYNCELTLNSSAEEGTRQVGIHPKFETARIYQEYLELEGDYPESLVELLAVTRPKSEWESRSDKQINRQLLPFYDFENARFVDIQVSPEHAEHGDRTLKRLTPEQEAKWHDLLGPLDENLPEGVELSDTDMENWYGTGRSMAPTGRFWKLTSSNWLPCATEHRTLLGGRIVLRLNSLGDESGKSPEGE